MKEIRVVLADDHPIFRTGMRHWLEQTPDIVVVGEAGEGESALRLVEELRPHILLLDVRMPILTGIEVARCIRERQSATRIIALSAYDDGCSILEMLAQGVDGYLVKEEFPEAILEAVRGVMRGQAGWLSRRAAAQVMRNTAKHPREPGIEALLSVREREVLQLVARGWPNEEIANVLHISLGTVKNHITNIYSRLGLRTRAQAVAWAWQRGMRGRVWEEHQKDEGEGG